MTCRRRYDVETLRFLRTKMSFCQYGLRDMLSFLTWRRRHVVNDVSSSSCRRQRRHDTSSTSTIDIETLPWTTRLRDMLTFRQLLFTFLYRKHSFLSTVLRVMLVFLVCNSTTLEQLRDDTDQCITIILASHHTSRNGTTFGRIGFWHHNDLSYTMTFLLPPGERFYNIKVAPPGDLIVK